MVNPRDDRMKWLDRALESKSDEVKARVLDIVLRYNVDPQNEFFMVIVAIGYLMVLVEDAPKAWQALFENFQQELEQWQATNLEVLNRLARQTESVANLVTITSEINNTLTKWTQACLKLMLRSNQSEQALLASTNQLQQSITSLTSLLQEIRSEQTQLNQRLDRLESHARSTQLSLQSRTQDWNFSTTICAAMCGLVLAGMGLLYWQQRTEAQQVQWLLEKANRLDCRLGIKPPESPECQNL